MELVALNSYFETVSHGFIYLNLQWNRQYYGAGTFTLLMQAVVYDKSMAYIYTKDRPEVGIIQKVEYESKISGKFITLSGFFMEIILDDKVLHPTFFANGVLENEITRMVNAYKADIPRLVVDASQGRGPNYTWQDTGGGMAEVATERLQEQFLSYHCTYNETDSNIHFNVWQGLDRTQSQAVNPYATFSDEFSNVGNIQISIDDSNIKNYGIVAGRGEGDDRITAYADNSGGGYQKQVWIDSRNSKFAPDEQSLAEYQADLQSDGFNSLATKYYQVQNAKVGLSASIDITSAQRAKNELYAPSIYQRLPLKYMEDYDLGDLCDVIVSDVGIEIQARIIAVNEVIKRNQHTIKLELGETILTRTQKARL